VVFDRNATLALWYSAARSKFQKPKELIFSATNGTYEEFDTGGDYDGAVWVFKSGDGFESVLLDKPLATSLFSRLYFLKGRGLKYFEPFYADDDAGIFVYRIKWDDFFSQSRDTSVSF